MVEHSLPSYRSVGVDRAPQFIYRSVSADPQPIVFNHPTIPFISTVPNQMSARLEVAGIDQGTEAFTDTSALIETLDEPLRQTVQFDAAAFTTGRYPYALTLTNHFLFSKRAAVVRDTLLIRNDQASPFGAGWTLKGLTHAYPQADGTVVLTKGNGGTMVFDRPTPGDFGHPITLPTDQTNGVPPLVADFNNDTFLDIGVPASFGVNGSIKVHLGDGQGGFGGAISSSVSGQPNA